MATLAINPGICAGSQAATSDPVAAPSTCTPTATSRTWTMPPSCSSFGAGNMAAFDFLLQKYRKPIIHFMYRMVHNQAVAEELAQEVFLRVYRSRETYRAEARFSTWLYRIATNLGVNHARDTRHERSASTVYLDETGRRDRHHADVADSTPGAEAAMLRRERMNAIREHVMALPSARAWPC